MGQIKDEYLNDLEYSALDSAGTYQVMEGFWNELYAGGYEDTYEHTVELLQPLMFMMTRGIAVNKDNLKLARDEAEKEMEQKQEKLNNCNKNLQNCR